jgi:hypothetical protein
VEEEDLAEEGSAVDTSVAAEAFTLVTLRWEDSNAAVWAVLEESAIPLVRGQRTDDQSMSGHAEPSLQRRIHQRLDGNKVLCREYGLIKPLRRLPGGSRCDCTSVTPAVTQETARPIGQYGRHLGDNRERDFIRCFAANIQSGWRE